VCPASSTNTTAVSPSGVQRCASTPFRRFRCRHKTLIACSGCNDRRLSKHVSVTLQNVQDMHINMYVRFILLLHAINTVVMGQNPSNQPWSFLPTWQSDSDPRLSSAVGIIDPHIIVLISFSFSHSLHILRIAFLDELSNLFLILPPLLWHGVFTAPILPLQHRMDDTGK